MTASRRAAGDLLRAARVRRPDHHRGDQDLAQGKGYIRHARHLDARSRWPAGSSPPTPSTPRAARIFLQLWHVGRISHPDLQPGGALPVAPSAVRAEDQQAYTDDGFKPLVTPRALETDEIPGIVADYAHAAQCAKDAGFDGVEIHGANGYLLHQFLVRQDQQAHRPLRRIDREPHPPRRRGGRRRDRASGAATASASGCRR